MKQNIHSEDILTIDRDGVISLFPLVPLRLATLLVCMPSRAIRRKIRKKEWVEGREYIKGKKGKIYINIKETINRLFLKS